MDPFTIVAAASAIHGGLKGLFGKKPGTLDASFGYRLPPEAMRILNSMNMQERADMMEQVRELSQKAGAFNRASKFNGPGLATSFQNRLNDYSIRSLKSLVQPQTLRLIQMINTNMQMKEASNRSQWQKYNAEQEVAGQFLGLGAGYFLNDKMKNVFKIPGSTESTGPLPTIPRYGTPSGVDFFGTGDETSYYSR